MKIFVIVEYDMHCFFFLLAGHCRPRAVAEEEKKPLTRLRESGIESGRFSLERSNDFIFNIHLHAMFSSRNNEDLVILFRP